MVPLASRHLGETQVDLQGLGYLISTISVLFLGVVAWPGPGDPEWQMWAVMIGMVLSVAGMFTRYVSHRRDRKDIHRVERKAEQS